MLRCSERLAGQRNKTAPSLAGAFCQELFQPRTKISDARRGYDRHLVAAEAACGNAQRSAELDARVLGRRHVRPAGTFHRQRGFKEPLDVEAHRRGWH